MTTYAELVQNIKDFMEDDGTEFSNEIDKFIDLAELRISRDVITPEFKRKVTSAFSANDPFLFPLVYSYRRSLYLYLRPVLSHIPYEFFPDAKLI